MFFVQGRWLSGLLFNWLFARIAAISQLKTIRVISLASWVLFIISFHGLMNHWKKWMPLSNYVIFLSCLYIGCSLSVAIYIGWASCFQIGLASLAGLWSGAILFDIWINPKHKKSYALRNITIGSLLGLCALSLYQVSFGVFLLPFGIYLVIKKSAAGSNIIIRGIVSYLVIVLLYYAVFLYSMKYAGIVASDRTHISFDVFGKFSFFFGIPLAQAFSLNLLYNTHNLISQVFPFLLIALWLFHSFRGTTESIKARIKYVGLILLLCLLIYLPVLVSKEDFSSYRTMFPFNFLITILILDIILNKARKKNQERLAAFVVMIIFILTGFRNFRYNFLEPLKDEYHALTRSVSQHYHIGIDSIVVLRPGEETFYKALGVVDYKDEFGLPSLYKEWTPDPLFRQLIFEKNKNHEAAKNLKVIQFTDKRLFDSASANGGANALFINPEKLLMDFENNKHLARFVK
ncbi:MAG: hypothetical protein ABIU63_14685 [Chitinophagaceae bacterium]